MMMNDELLQKVIQEISANHHKIIDDWCKAYMAQLYSEGIAIMPGSVTLCEQVPTYYKGKDCSVRKYWFEPGKPIFENNEVKNNKEEIMQPQKASDNMKVFFQNLLDLKEYIMQQYETHDINEITDYVLMDIYDRLDKIIKVETNI